MKIKNLALCFGFLLCISVALQGFARADIYFENENVTTKVPHQKDGTAIQKNYLTAGASRIEMGDGKVVIVDYNSMKMYTLNPQAKTYTLVDMNEMGMPANLPAAEKEKMGKVMGSMMTINVVPTNETKTIEGYSCKKYNVTMAMIQGEYWVTQDIKGYKELKSIAEKLAAILEKNPMLRQMSVAGMVEKLNGFPVVTTNKVMGGTVVSTLKKVEQKQLDPELFKVPKGYAQKESQGAGGPQ